MPYRNPNIRQAARGERCTLQGPNCTGGGEDTVACHLNYSWAGKGMGQKAHDFAVVFGCAACHRDLDSHKLDDEYFYVLRALVKTWQRLFERGILK